MAQQAVNVIPFRVSQDEQEIRASIKDLTDALNVTRAAIGNRESAAQIAAHKRRLRRHMQSLHLQRMWAREKLADLAALDEATHSTV